MRRQGNWVKNLECLTDRQTDGQTIAPMSRDPVQSNTAIFATRNQIIQTGPSCVDHSSNCLPRKPPLTPGSHNTPGSHKTLLKGSKASKQVLGF